MATIKGTDGNDVLKGTAANDVLQPRTGTDTVDGGAGIDTLLYSEATYYGRLELLATNAAGTSGTLTVGSVVSTKFNNIESLDITCGSCRIDANLAFGPGKITVTGGGSGSTILLNLEGAAVTAGVTLTLGTDNVTIGKSVFRNFEYIILYTTKLDDIVTGSAIGDSIYANGGNDRLEALGGNDALNGGDGNDTLLGGADNDFLNGGFGSDTLYGGDGNDELWGFQLAKAEPDKGSDVLDGGAGNDRLFGDAGDTFIGGPGRDTLGLDLSTMKSGINVNLAPAFSGGSVTFDSGIFGSTKISGVERYNYLILTDYADVLTLGNAARYINTTVTGRVDVFTGVTAGGGDDKVFGSSNPDYIFGGLGNDKLYGGDGYDHLIGEVGDDTLVGGSGNDGLAGDTGNDQLDGGAGNDGLLGGDGNDILRGGAGIDTLDGGDGKDTFVFAPGEYGTTRATADYINAFQPQQLEQIDLSLIDANSAVAGNQAFTFIGGAAFSVAGQLRVTTEGTGFSKVTWVEGDINGDGIADMIIKLGPMTGTLPLPDLAAINFIL